MQACASARADPDRNNQRRDANPTGHHLSAASTVLPSDAAFFTSAIAALTEVLTELSTVWSALKAAGVTARDCAAMPPDPLPRRR